MKPCTCGSGLPRYDLTDAAGIFCRYVCEDCEKEARSHYNPAIFASGSHYAASGEEEDLFRDERPAWGSQEWAETYGDDLGESPDY